jgi:hypothetical protein
MPTMDVVGRAGFHKVTDGTNTAAVKAASTAAIAMDTALVVAVSPNNTPVLPSDAATQTTLALLPVAQASTTSGQSGPLMQGAVTTAAPSYTTAKTSPFSLTTAAALRVDASATTQPISAASNIPVSQATAASLKATTFPGGSSSYNTNGVNETRTVRTGAGILRGLIVNPGTASTFVVYDNTAGSGTVLAALTTGAAGGNGYSVACFDVAFSTGLTYVSTGGCNITLVYYF